MTHNFTEGQKVRILAGRHAGKLGTVKEVDGGNIWVLADGAFTVAPYTPEELAPVRSDDTVPASVEEVVEYVTGRQPEPSNVDVYLHEACGTRIPVPTGADLHATITAHEATCPALLRARYVDPEDGVVGHGFSELDPHTCEMNEPHDGDHVCDECGETWGSVDQFRCPLEEVEEHRRSHRPKTLGEVSAIRQYLAIKDVAPGVFDGLFAVVNTPAVEVANALRALADVLEEEAR